MSRRNKNQSTLTASPAGSAVHVTPAIPGPPSSVTASKASLSIGGEIRSVSSPVPSPDDLARYEGICPGAAEVFMRQFEKQMEHHREMDVSDRKLHEKGLYVSGILLFVVLAVLAGAIYAHMQWVALAMSIVPVIAVAAYWRRTRSSNSLAFMTTHANLQALTEQQKLESQSSPDTRKG